MLMLSCTICAAAVALPTEGVDRNGNLNNYGNAGLASPSPRRAWIEISMRMTFLAAITGRPPHGGRG